MGSCDPHEHWRGIIVSGFWPNTDWQTKKIVFSHSGLHKIKIISREQSTKTLEPFWSDCTNEAQKNAVGFLSSSSLSFSYIYIYKKKCPLQVHWDTGNQWICLQTARVGGWGEGVGSGRNSQPQQLILKWCPLGTKKTVFTLFFSSSCQQRAGLMVVAPAHWQLHGTAYWLVE